MAEAENPTEAKEKPKKPTNPTVFVLLNTIAILGATGFLYYSKFIFKRPAITESTERARLAEMKQSPSPQEMPDSVPFESITVNIASHPGAPRPAEGTSEQIQGKLHYVTLAFSLQIKDSSRKDQIDAIRPLLLDKLLSILGRKTYTELNTTQGRYVLRSQILDSANHLVATRATPAGENADSLVTGVFFTQFIVQ